MSQTPFNTNSPSVQSQADFSQIPYDVLESVRNRLNQIRQSLVKLADQINNHNRHPNKIKLPTYSHFQNQFQVLITQLTSIASQLYHNEDLLKNTNVYPTPNFPTSAHENMLTTLLRKKVSPEVDEWMNDAKLTIDNKDLDLSKTDELVTWYLAKIQDLRDEFQFYGFHTVEELDYMETAAGKQEQKEKKDKEHERDQIDLKITGGGKKSLHPNQVLKFMCQGQL
ncbi:MED8 Mediator of RNA polymerase II transcription subunit 8 [Candida maltosa Xu316]